MPATIDDVASRAGVSTKTVSRVLNGHTTVRAKLRTRIEIAIAELNYVPNASARGLASNRSYLIALLYDNPTAGSNYVMELIVGVLQACAETPYNAVLHPFETGDDLIQRIDGFVARHRPDALILAPPHANNLELMQRLDKLDVRYATISSKLQDPRIDIGFHERRAAADMVSHLVDLGHRRIGHIAGLKGHGARTWRLNGYRDALRQADIAFDKSLVVSGDFTFASGVVGARALLDLDDPPTAIFAANDDVACGAIRAAYERGWSVPEQISVCGFDNTPVSLLVSPSLTTVHQPCREMGRQAVASVLDSIRAPMLERRVQVPYELMIRGSTTAPRAP